jgi:hypothetical protein
LPSLVGSDHFVAAGDQGARIRNCVEHHSVEDRQVRHKGMRELRIADFRPAHELQRYPVRAKGRGLIEIEPANGIDVFSDLKRLADGKHAILPLQGSGVPQGGGDDDGSLEVKISADAIQAVFHKAEKVGVGMTEDLFDHWHHLGELRGFPIGICDLCDHLSGIIAL